MIRPGSPRPNRFAAAGGALRRSVLVKLIVIALLSLGLLIPLAMVGSLVREREGRQRQAEAEVSRTWGAEQTLVGPLLSVPYTRTWTQNGLLHAVEEEVVLLPAALEVEATIEPEVRNLGIFEVVVYRTRIHLEGRFDPPAEALAEHAGLPLEWREARLVLGVPDLRGLRSGPEIGWRGRQRSLRPGTGGSRLSGGIPGGSSAAGLHLPLPELAGDGRAAGGEFSLDLVLSGSRRLQLAPVGRETVLHMRSSWPDPAFVGPFLPAERRVTEQGFDARWQISYLGRGYPESWRSEQGGDGSGAVAAGVLQTSAVGVELANPVDGYRKTDRAIKYAILFIVVTFGAFFLFEVFRPTLLHPMHYLLVGFALCLFYLLLLSVSEYLPFGVAYGVAALATVALIAGYSKAVLAGGGRALVMAAVLGGLFGYLYVLLQIRDYALLLGALGLFVILAAFMYLTRGIDWHGLQLGGLQEEEAVEA